MNVTAVDLFCGAGGLTHGLERTGIDVVAGLDANESGRYAYEANNDADFVTTDIHPIAKDPERVARLFPFHSDLTVLAACAPCQPYSTLAHARDGDADDHEKYGLLDKVAQIIADVEPDVVVTENVETVRNDEVYQSFEDRLEVWGYTLNPEENRSVYCPEYGVPQKRKRWVMLASREGPIELPDPTHPDPERYTTAREAIGHLPPIEAGEVHPDLDLHRARDLSEKNLERIRNMEPGGDWRLWEEEGLDHLLADCHKRASGRSYKAPYSRMVADEPAPTITTQFYNYGSGRFGHYDTDQDRALTPLEGALLQTFPEDYDFFEEWEEVGINKLGQLIGNAVPPRLGEVVGQAILEHVEDGDEATSADRSPLLPAADD